MSETMTAFRMLNWGEQPQKAEVAVPSSGPGQVLIKVAGVGVCGSDPKMRKIPDFIGEMLNWNMPFTLGHEVGGWIETVGEGVDGFAPGEAVVLMSTHSCGACSYCVEGADINCDEGHYGRGYGRDGGLAPYVLVDHPREIIKISTLDPVTAGPLTDAAVIPYHGVRRVLPKLKPGSKAVVIGAGGLGSFAVQLLKVLSPTSVIAVDNNASRLEYVQGLGADVLIDSSEGSTSQQLQEILGTEGAAAVLDFVGVDDTIEVGLGCLRKGGSYALIGSSGGKLEKEWYSALPKDGEVFTYEGASLSEMHEVIALAEAGKIRNDVDIYSFDEVEKAYAQLESGQLQGRAVIKIAT
jgi:alcohol dehydrogenase, propanol-preferring